MTVFLLCMFAQKESWSFALPPTVLMTPEAAVGPGHQKNPAPYSAKQCDDSVPVVFVSIFTQYQCRRIYIHHFVLIHANSIL